jgi:hypothetical protein
MTRLDGPPSGDWRDRCRTHRDRLVAASGHLDRNPAEEVQDGKRIQKFVFKGMKQVPVN